MALHMKWSDRSKQLLPTGEQAWGTVLEFLRHRYVREKQHAMRYRQHAERIDPQFRDTLIRMAAEEEQHAASIGARIRDLGESFQTLSRSTLPRKTTAGLTCERTWTRSSAAGAS